MLVVFMIGQLCLDVSALTVCTLPTCKRRCIAGKRCIRTGVACHRLHAKRKGRQSASRNQPKTRPAYLGRLRTRRTHVDAPGYPTKCRRATAVGLQTKTNRQRPKQERGFSPTKNREWPSEDTRNKRFHPLGV